MSRLKLQNEIMKMEISLQNIKFALQNVRYYYDTLFGMYTLLLLKLLIVTNKNTKKKVFVKEYGRNSIVYSTHALFVKFPIV